MLAASWGEPARDIPACLLYISRLVSEKCCSYQNLCQLYHTLQKAIMFFNKHTVTCENVTFRKHTFSHNY